MLNIKKRQIALGVCFQRINHFCGYILVGPIINYYYETSIAYFNTDIVGELNLTKTNKLEHTFQQ